ncbi:MAG TPA: biopolymer transporter ExbD [bacterium]|nr:biopolymer transporter ExbD [bacterium]HEX68632.1 biopolymer transporter ExbD [bacterium]
MRWERRGYIIWPELTPLVDVVLILLIFFSLSSSFIILPGAKIELPSSHFSWKKEKEELHLTLTADNLLFIENKLIDWENLTWELEKKLLKHPQLVLIIHADKRVSLEKVINILDKAREAGVKKFAIATEKKK